MNRFATESEMYAETLKRFQCKSDMGRGIDGNVILLGSEKIKTTTGRPTHLEILLRVRQPTF